MLQEFLNLLGKTTGKTFTPAEFKQILEAAMKVEETKKEEKPSDKKSK